MRKISRVSSSQRSLLQQAPPARVGQAWRCCAWTYFLAMVCGLLLDMTFRSWDIWINRWHPPSEITKDIGNWGNMPANVLLCEGFGGTPEFASVQDSFLNSASVAVSIERMENVAVKSNPYAGKDVDTFRQCIKFNLSSLTPTFDDDSHSSGQNSVWMKYQFYVEHLHSSVGIPLALDIFIGGKFYATIGINLGHDIIGIHYKSSLRKFRVVDEDLWWEHPSSVIGWPPHLPQTVRRAEHFVAGGLSSFPVLNMSRAKDRIAGSTGRTGNYLSNHLAYGILELAVSDPSVTEIRKIGLAERLGKLWGTAGGLITIIIYAFYACFRPKPGQEPNLPRLTAHPLIKRLSKDAESEDDSEGESEMAKSLIRYGS